MMTDVGTTTAPAASDVVVGFEPAILYLDPDTAALFAEVDAILCAALTPARRLPAPPVNGWALISPSSADRSCGALVRPRRGPKQLVRAVQRSPPTPQLSAIKVNGASERQVMASQQT